MTQLIIKTGTTVPTPDSGYAAVTMDAANRLTVKNSSGVTAVAASGHRRVQTAADGATITPNCDAYDMVKQINAQGAGTLTIANPTGTPADGQELVLVISATSGTQTLSFGNAYSAAQGLALPTTVTASQKNRYVFYWSSTDSKWYIIASLRLV